MGTARLQPNTTQIPNFFLDVLMRDLTDTELRILLYIARQTYGWIEDPETKKRKEKDWIAYSQLEEKTGRFKQAITAAIRGLENKNLIEVLDVKGDLIPLEKRAGKRLFYRIKTGVNTIQDNDNLGENQNLIITQTKETNTKALPKGNGEVTKKLPSCPLIEKEKEHLIAREIIELREKYPNGHLECVEYLQDEESKRGFKFINLSKQYLAIHKILKAGYSFDRMDKTIRLVEKKYSAHSWDYMTLANWLEKGSGNG